MNNRRQFLKKGTIAALSTMASGAFVDINAAGRKSGFKTSALDGCYYAIEFVFNSNMDELAINATRIVNRILTQRIGQNVNKTNKKLRVCLEIGLHATPSDSFQISQISKDTITIIAADSRGILFGLGKLLHSSNLTINGLVPGNWHGLSIPDKPFRKIYFATHFYNFYHSAPLEKIKEYIEELALWGYNGLVVWFDMHHFTGINDPKAQEMLDRLAFLLRKGKKVGMDSALTLLANEGYSTTPESLKATPPLQLKVRGRFGVEICPSRVGGSELILNQIVEEMDAFVARGVTPDYLSIWPYDQGGCGCKDCTPWGSNGFLKMTNLITEMAKKKIPGIKIIQSTWLFDAEVDEGEWYGLSEAYRVKPPLVDFIMADSHNEFPEYLLDNPAPGNLPLLNFPEISMWGSFPWGGFGANPLPQRFNKIWDSVKNKLVGGFPYSEGIFEDINKVIYSQFYWNSNSVVYDIVREYVSFEYSEQYAEEITEVIFILEKNHGLNKRRGNSKAEIPQQDYGAERAFRIIQHIDTKLPKNVRNSWRWRILAVRVMLDYEFRRNKGLPNEKTDAGFRELIDLYHVGGKSMPSVHPPL